MAAVLPSRRGRAAVPPLLRGRGRPGRARHLREPPHLPARRRGRWPGGAAGPRGSLAFAPGSFFQGYDVGPAVAHEHAAAVLGVLDREDLRALAGDPRELDPPAANLAISTLTLRADGAAATFPLHWRDPAKVGHAGGLFQVVPVGIFQAADDGPASQAQDFDLWRGMTREFAEELLGTPEEYGPAGTAVDYGAWPFARQLNAARDGGAVRPWVLGLGVDPLTLATDLLTAVVIDAPVFDELFGAMVSRQRRGTDPAGTAVHGRDDQPPHHPRADAGRRRRPAPARLASSRRAPAGLAPARSAPARHDQSPGSPPASDSELPLPFRAPRRLCPVEQPLSRAPATHGAAVSGVAHDGEGRSGPALSPRPGRSDP